MSYVTIIAFGLLGLCFAVASQISLARGRRKIEVAQQSIQSKEVSIAISSDEVIADDMHKPFGTSVLSQGYKTRQVRSITLNAKRGSKYSKTK